MSEPVTNVEIEDVLSSIRRLVSDGDKARAHDAAPEGAPEDMPDANAELPEPTPEVDQPEAELVQDNGIDSARDNDRLVLSPALMVVAHDDEAEASDEPTPEPDAEAADVPFRLTGMITAVESEVSEKKEAFIPPAATDRSDLVATIAELEAAISAGGDDYEPDGSEVASETIVWPGSAARREQNVIDIDIDIEPDHDAANADSPVAEDDIAPMFLTSSAANHNVGEQDTPDAMVEDMPDAVVEDITEALVEDTPDDVVEDISQDVIEDVNVDPSAEPEAADVFVDDDFDALADESGLKLDEDALRALVADVVRQELVGELGDKITRNVRKLVRREIYRILSSQDFD